MPYIRYLLLTLAGLAALHRPACAQLGRTFLFSVPPNFRNTDLPVGGAEPALIITIGADRATKVRIRAGGIAKDTILVVPEMNVSRITLPMTASNWTDSLTANATIRIDADNPVAVTCLSQRFQTSESFAVLPVEALGTNYMLTAYTQLAVDLLATSTITAVEDGTAVTVTSPGATNLGPANAPVTVTMRAGQSIRVTAKWVYGDAGDLTGTVVAANKPVSVVSAHRCAYVPAGVEACNFLVEHMVPTTLWGRSFIVPDVPGRSRHTVRVLALEDGTTARIAGTTVQLARSRYTDLTLDEAVLVTADRPVAVMLYAHGFKDADSVGDPMMVTIPPAGAWSTDLVAMRPGLSCERQDLVLFGTQEALAGTTINGRRLDTMRIRPFAEGHATAMVDADLDYLVIRSPLPVGGIVLGLGTATGKVTYDAYGHGVVAWTKAPTR